MFICALNMGVAQGLTNCCILQSGLPVLANINAGNNLAEAIRDQNVGQVCESNQLDGPVRLSEVLLRQINEDLELPARCRALFEREYSVGRAVRQIVGALEHGRLDWL